MDKPKKCIYCNSVIDYDEECKLSLRGVHSDGVSLRQAVYDIVNRAKGDEDAT